MKIIELLVVLLLVFLLVNFYTGGFKGGGENEVIIQKKIYIESQEKLEKSMKTMEEEYKKNKKID